MSNHQLNGNESSVARRNPSNEMSHPMGLPNNLPRSVDSEGWRDHYHRNSSITTLSLSSRNHTLFASGSSNWASLNESYRSFAPNIFANKNMPPQQTSPIANRRPSIFTTVSGSRYYHDGKEVAPLNFSPSVKPHSKINFDHSSNTHLDDSLQPGPAQRLQYPPSPPPFPRNIPPVQWGNGNDMPPYHPNTPSAEYAPEHRQSPHDLSARHRSPASAADLYYSAPPTHSPPPTMKSVPSSSSHHRASAALTHHDHPYRQLKSIHYFDHIPPPAPPHYATRCQGVEPITREMISAPSQRCLLKNIPQSS